MNKIWKRFRVWAYIRLMRLELKIAVRSYSIWDKKQRLKAMSILTDHITAAIYDEFPNHEELQKVKLELIGTVCGFILVDTGRNLPNEVWGSE